MKFERRRAARLIKRVPMRIRLVEEIPFPEQSVEAMNISMSGAYFATDLVLSQGVKLEVRLKMPEGIFASGALEWKFMGRVAHVERLGDYGKSGVGVQFLYYSLA